MRLGGERPAVLAVSTIGGQTTMKLTHVAIQSSSVLQAAILLPLLSATSKLNHTRDDPQHVGVVELWSRAGTAHPVVAAAPHLLVWGD